MSALALIQGMRRSGTTILYDLLCEDPGLACFYEPLAAARPSIGGGSGVQDVDVFESLHEARRDFAREHPELIDPSVLNHGAPRDWRLEFERDLPPLIRAYLQFLFDREDAVAVKFTRMSRKIPALAEIAGDARFIQIVRDPRAVVVSYLFGKGHRRGEGSPRTPSASSPTGPTGRSGRASSSASTSVSSRAFPPTCATSRGSWPSGATPMRRPGAGPTPHSGDGGCWSATRTCAAIRPGRSAASTSSSAGRCPWPSSASPRPRSAPSRPSSLPTTAAGWTRTDDWECSIWSGRPATWPDRASARGCLRRGLNNRGARI